jgi:hypothetical protein
VPNPTLAYEPLRITTTVLPTPNGGTSSFTTVGPQGGPIHGCTALPVSPQGTASCVTYITRANYYFGAATYSGDADFGPSGSPDYRITVEPGAGSGAGVFGRRIGARHLRVSIPRSCVKTLRASQSASPAPGTCAGSTRGSTAAGRRDPPSPRPWTRQHRARGRAAPGPTQTDARRARRTPAQVGVQGLLKTR